MRDSRTIVIGCQVPMALFDLLEADRVLEQVETGKPINRSRWIRRAIEQYLELEPSDD